MIKWLIIGGIFLGCAAAFLVSWIYVSAPRGTQVATSQKKQPVDITTLRVKAEAGDPKAQAQLGDAYAKGEGVTNNYSEAAKWYRLAAEKGSAEAELGLGQLYEAGQGVSKDLAQAIKLYRQAAEHGLPGAQYTLGFMYEAGRGLPASQTEAAKWFLRAAEQGEPLAQYDMGQRYDLGIGVSVDRVEALKWLILAAKQGQTDSADRRDKVRQTMPRSEVAEAERRASAFMPKRLVNPP